jgi:hypothetical protein
MSNCELDESDLIDIDADITEEELQRRYPQYYYPIIENNKEIEVNNKLSITFNTIKDELRRFYYENQYDDERYPHFRACDKHIEFDMDGGEHIYYQFYD